MALSLRGRPPANKQVKMAPKKEEVKTEEKQVSEIIKKVPKVEEKEQPVVESKNNNIELKKNNNIEPKKNNNIDRKEINSLGLKISKPEMFRFRDPISKTYYWKRSDKMDPAEVAKIRAERNAKNRVLGV